MSAYVELEGIFSRISALRGASAILDWDAATQLPSGSSQVRGEQLAQLAELAHEMITSPRVTDLLAKAEEERLHLPDWQQANLREMRHRWVHENAVDTRLVGAMSKAATASEHYWRTARKENDFAGFATHLETVLELVREIAHCKASAMSLSPYDALIDSYDPGTRSAMIDRQFAKLEAFLPGFIPQVIESQARRAAPMPLQGPFDVAAQKSLGISVMKALGFDFTQGRLDVSAHPFCGGVPGDVRITTRYSEENFTESFYGVIHETGHALYEAGLPSDWVAQPVGEARGMAMHESQSLLMEMQLSRGRDFLHFAAPKIREAFGVSGAQWEPENLYRLATEVRPSLIRVSADEVTYPCHILLRYGLEKQLIAGTLEVEDIPTAWEEGMQQLLGIAPDNHANGCMQDIHWPHGSFGYFPTYTLGAMIAAQLYDFVGKNINDLAGNIRKGNFEPLVEWLNDHIHCQGSYLTTDALLTQATGKPLDADIFITHLTRRYLAE